MPWATPNDVLAIYPTTVDVRPFLTTAYVLVQNWLGAAGLAPALLLEIERWLTAHLMSMGDGSLTRMKVGDTELAYDSRKLGTGLSSTLYGQTVLALDPTGILASLGLKRATIFVD